MTPSETETFPSTRTEEFTMTRPTDRETQIYRFLKICQWAETRYTKGGELTLTVRGTPTRYLRIENAAYTKYIL